MMATLDVRGLAETAQRFEAVNDAATNSREAVAAFAESLAKHFAIAQASTEAFESGITHKMAEEWGRRIAGLKSFLGEKESLEQTFAEKHRKTEEGINAFINGSAEDRLAAMYGMFGGISGLLGRAGEENRAAAIVQKAVALAEAGINTARAVAVSLASAPFPVNVGLGAATAAAGAAQIAKIRATQIPSAETGGRFMVPGTGGVDGSLMRVNPGEEVNVTPRGMAGGGEVSQYIFKINEEVIFDIVNRGGKSGDIYVFEPAGNM